MLFGPKVDNGTPVEHYSETESDSDDNTYIQTLNEYSPIPTQCTVLSTLPLGLTSLYPHAPTFHPAVAREPIRLPPGPADTDDLLEQAPPHIPQQVTLE